MPTLGNALDFSKYEGRNFRAHQLGAAPSSPVTGQLYYDTVGNVLYYYNGSAWIAAGAGAGPADATTSSKGVVQLAGDLAGTAVSPQIAAGVIVDADVNSGAAIAESKLSLATDAAVGTGSRRTLGAGAQQAMPGNRTLDVITAPAADLNLNSKKITSLLDPASAQDAATKNYVDNSVQGLDAKASVKVATTASISGGSAPAGAQTIDGYAIVNGDRVLVKDQANPQYNGIYQANTVSSWNRVLDADAWAELPSAYVWVEQGTVNGDTGWVCTVDSVGTINTTPVTWTQFSGAAMITAGAGLTKTGNSLDVVGLAGGGVTVAADSIAVDATVARYYNNGAVHGAGTTITITQATHGLRASQAIHVQVQDSATGAIEWPDVTVGVTGNVLITYGASQGANTKLVTLVG